MEFARIEIGYHWKELIVRPCWLDVLINQDFHYVYNYTDCVVISWLLLS